MHSLQAVLALASIAAAAASSPLCATSCGATPAWQRPADGTVPPPPTQTPVWDYAYPMTPQGWYSFPYGQPRRAATQAAVGSVSTGREFASQYYLWGAPMSTPLVPNTLGVDVWYTLSFSFRASEHNNVRGVAR